MRESQNDSSLTTGKVTGITSFGAFIKLADGQEGLVHISEIADTYISNISDFLSLNQEVKIKILGTNKKGKLDLSIKKVPGQKLEKSGGGGASGGGASKGSSREPMVYSKYKYSQQVKKTPQRRALP